MKPFIHLLILIFFLSGYDIAQENDVSPLFQNDEPLEVRLTYSFKSLRKDTNDTLYMPTHLSYKDENGVWDSVPIVLRTRGNFRKNHCYYPPLRIKIKKKNGKGNLFEGNKNLKLVLPCQTTRNANDLVVKEFLCYKLYEPITPYFFNSRLVNLTLTNDNGKHSKVHEIKAFFIEDDDVVAKRFDSKIMEGMQINPMLLQDTASTTHDFFQFMIANTDWSTFAQHNVKIMHLPPRSYVPLAYDFDMSGLVSAPYAVVSDLLPINSVRDRLYRGFCRNEGLFEYVRSEYIRIEPEIWASFKAVEPHLNQSDLSSMRTYIEEFFGILKNDRRFKSEILTKCRTRD